MLGEIDVLVCGNSDPGTSGLLSPYAKIKGLYFNDDDEPDDFYYTLTNDIEEICKKDGINFVRCEFDNARDFYNALKAMDKFTNDSIKISGTSREGEYDIVLTKEADLDDKTKPSYKSEVVEVIEADSSTKKEAKK